MNKNEKKSILTLALYHLGEMKRLRNPNDTYENLIAIQVCRDVLAGFKYHNFIQDFDLDKGILMNEVWHTKGN